MGSSQKCLRWYQQADDIQTELCSSIDSASPGVCVRELSVEFGAITPAGRRSDLLNCNVKVNK